MSLLVVGSVAFDAVETPFGNPSDVITVGKVEDVSMAFLPRHGRGHVVGDLDSLLKQRAEQDVIGQRPGWFWTSRDANRPGSRAAG